MKKLFTFLFTSLMLNTFAADLYVFPSASSPNYSSINDAINAASDGDRILVAQSTYVENVEIPAKNLTIAPLSDGENYTISGTMKITATYDGITINIIGAVVQGDFEEINNTSSNCSGPLINEVNIIDCHFYQAFYPARCVVTNLYYSTLSFSSGSYYGMYKEIIGNHFVNTSGSSKEFHCYLIDVDWSNAANTLYGDDKTQKVFANHFENVKLRYVYAQSNISNWTDEVHIANNYFDLNDHQGSYFRHLDISVDQTASFLIENNTFSKTEHTSNSGSWCVNISGQDASVIVRNNAFYSNQGWSNTYPVFNISMGSGILIVTNNLFNNSSWPSNLNTGSINSFSNYYFSGSVGGGSVSSSDNYFNTSSFYHSQIAVGSGIVTTPMAIDNGLDIMDCRDIDDTKNNIGTWGGPHSWNNYHSVSSGKGRIIDLNIPSTIYGLPGVSFNVKSKAVRKN